MANLKEVRIRIKSVSSTQQITKAMKLVSATKLRKAQSGIIQMRPYANKLKNIMQNLSDSIDSPELAVYFNAREAKKVLMIVVTSDRGLCGAFNANVCKLGKSLLVDEYMNSYTKGDVTIMPIGKKGFEYFSKDKNITIDVSNRETFLNLTSENVFEIGDQILEMYRDGKFDKVIVVYNQFKNAATQILTAEQLLPVMKPLVTETTSKKDYVFEPSKADLLSELIPRSLKTQIYKACLDSFASEHGARMVAMEKATENAGDMLKSLRLQYNQARQAAITKELSEIVGGAAAMNG